MIASKKTIDNSQNKLALLSEKAWNIIKENKVKNIDRADLKKRLEEEMVKENFNLYKFAAKYFYCSCTTYTQSHLLRDRE